MVDNYEIWAAHDAELERELAKRPVCAECGDPIQTEHCYEVKGELICPDCMEKYHRKYTEDFEY